MLTTEALKMKPRTLEFRVFHGVGGPESAQRVRVSAAADGRLPNTDELTELLCQHLDLEDPETATDIAPGPTHSDGTASPPRRDRNRTWRLRNLTKGDFIRSDTPEIDQDDVIEVIDRSVAG